MSDKKRRVPTRPLPIRFTSSSLEFIDLAAARQQVSRSDYIREAALIRAAIDLAGGLSKVDLDSRDAFYEEARGLLKEHLVDRHPSDG